MPFDLVDPAGFTKERTRANLGEHRERLLKWVLAKYRLVMVQSPNVERSHGLNWLTDRTLPGLFVASGAGPRFWIFDSLERRIALQLDASPERPAISYYELGRKPIELGVWMGPVGLALGSAINSGGYREAGFICAYRNRLLVKANGSDGVGKQLAIVECDSPAYCPYSIFYRRWSLFAVGKHQLCWFVSPERVARMQPYSEIDSWTAPALTLCSSEPN